MSLDAIAPPLDLPRWPISRLPYSLYRLVVGRQARSRRSLVGAIQSSA